MNPLCTTFLALVLPFWPMQNKQADKYHEEITEMSIGDNISTPSIPKKKEQMVRDHMQALASRLKKSGFTVDLEERDGLVACITIPMSQLFEANDTLISPQGARLLTPLPTHLRTPDQYKILIAAHSDDTGTEEYLNALTATRADAIAAWLAANGVSAPSIVAYGMGFDEPIAVNPSRKSRAKNRRLEIYLVPGPTLLK